MWTQQEHEHEHFLLLNTSMFLNIEHLLDFWPPFPLSPASCHGPADAPPLYLLLFTWIVKVWSMPTTHYSYISVIFIECVVTL